jgi:hypothetical protein
MQLDPETLTQFLLVMAGSGVGLVAIAQVFKKTLRRFGVDSDAVIHTVVIALAAALGALQYFQEFHAQLPASVLGVSTVTIYGFSQMIFKYGTYALNFLNRVSAYNQSQAAKQEDVNKTGEYLDQMSSASPTPPVSESAPAPGFEL